MHSDVLHAAWRAAHRPEPPQWVPRTSGRCARCHTAGPLTPIHTIVSAKFTAWHIIDPGGTGLCMPCTWGFTTPELRAGDTLITDHPTCQELAPAALFGILTNPIPARKAVVVISRPNRKHAVPAARWGHIHLDDDVVSWTSHDTRRLHHLHRLRQLGFPTRSIAEMTPPPGILSRLPANEQLAAIDSWHAITAWRAGDRRDALTIALRATTNGNHLEDR